MWVVLDRPWHEGPNSITPFENWTLDLRFRHRGERPAPIKIFYINLDSASLKMMGERPWNLDFFADVAQVAFKLGKAKALGFDFVFSDKMHSSSLLDEQKVKDSEVHLASAIVAFAPRIVLGAQYTQVHLEYLQDGNIARWGSFPYIRDGYTLPSNNPYPEVPTYPLIGPNWGRIGFLENDEDWSDGAIPRFAPLFSEFKGGSDSLSILVSMRDAGGLPLDSIKSDDTDFILYGAKGQEICRMPKIRERTFYAFALELLLSYYGLGTEAVQFDQNELLIVQPVDLSEGSTSKTKVLHRIPLLAKQVTAINWFSRWDSPRYNPSIGIADLYRHILNYQDGAGRAYEEAKAIFSQMEGAIVLVGPTDSSLDELVPTPFDEDPVPNVSVHGNLLKTFFSGHFLHFASGLMRAAIIIGLTLILSLITLFAGHLGHWVKLVIAFGFCAYIGFTFWVFEAHQFVLPVVAPVGAAVMSTLLSLLLHVLYEEKQKGRIKTLFGTYVSPQIVDELVDRDEDPKLGGADLKITCFFSDIHKFTAFAEKLEPSELVKLMNEYFEAMTLILQKEGGTLDKYIGDAIVAMFGAPLKVEDHALRACVAACRVQSRQEELALMWSRQGKRWPVAVHHMTTRVGLNTGFAVVGNMGSQKRFNYTMMGDTVNLAARTESAGKVYGVPIIVTAATKKEASHSNELCLFRELDTVILPGKTKPVCLYELIGIKEDLPDSVFECVHFYEQALAAYKGRSWTKALSYLEKAAELEPNQSTHMKQKNALHPSSLLKLRVQKYKQKPPSKAWQPITRL